MSSTADDRATKPKLGAQTIHLTPGREPSSFLISRFSAALYVTDVVESSTELARPAGAASGPKPFLSGRAFTVIKPERLEGKEIPDCKAGQQRDEVRR
jgi:hypothetical protein